MRTLHRTGHPGACQVRQMCTSRHGITPKKPSPSTSTAVIPSRLTLLVPAYCSEGFNCVEFRSDAFSCTQRSELQKLTYPQAGKKFPVFYGTRMFISVFTTAGQLALFKATSIYYMPLPPNPLRSFLILSSDLLILSRKRKSLSD